MFVAADVFPAPPPHIGIVNGLGGVCVVSVGDPAEEPNIAVTGIGADGMPEPVGTLYTNWPAFIPVPCNAYKAMPISCPVPPSAPQLNCVVFCVTHAF